MHQEIAADADILFVDIHVTSKIVHAIIEAKSEVQLQLSSNKCY